MKFESIKNVLDGVNGATFAGIDTVTKPMLRGGQKNPLQGRVTKKTEGAVVMLFTNKLTNAYESMVKRRLEQEGKDPSTFELKPRAWGQRIPNTPFVEHKDEKYLECIFIKGGRSAYFIDGQEVPKDAIQGLPEAESNEQAQGGLDNKVIIRTYALNSIEQIRVLGETLNRNQ
jgi:hypothetical protein